MAKIPKHSAICVDAMEARTDAHPLTVHAYARWQEALERDSDAASKKKGIFCK